ncbi:hypothetical protein KDX23_02845 [Burkholderia vietnamiensis]|nr:hypothetical protein [Burkholderia vietnamiensis]
MNEILESRRLPQKEKIRLIKNISSYIRRKSDDSDPHVIAEKNASLRKVRNELAHGKLSLRSDFTPFYPLLWQAITRLAKQIDPEELENLLAYGLDVNNLNLTQTGATPTKIVSVYRPRFNALDPDQKKSAFADLLLKLFSDPRSINLLEKNSTR